MAFSKILAIIVAAMMVLVDCSVVASGVAPIAYQQVAPPNIIPFAASVNTFTRGLPLFAAPYAAGVAPVPYLPSTYSAPVLPGSVPVTRLAPAPAPGPAPVYPGFAPQLVPAPVPFGARSVHAVAPGFVPNYGHVLSHQVLG